MWEWTGVVFHEWWIPWKRKDLSGEKNDPEDRRKVLISLTEKGERCYDFLNRKSEEMAAEILGLVEEQDLRDFEKGLETMLRVLRKIDSAMESRK